MEYSLSNKLTTIALLLALAVFVAAVHDAKAICNMSSEGFDAGMPSVSGPNPTGPSQECCSALAGADHDCLCSYRNSALLPSLGIDPDLAMQLPEKCGLYPPRRLLLKG